MKKLLLTSILLTSISIVGFAQTAKQDGKMSARAKAIPNETMTQKRTRIVKSSAAKSNKNTPEAKKAVAAQSSAQITVADYSTKAKASN